ncbi:S8/S53 family peptidase [Halorussus ruber]|uniref:S8/S53 family peptidase n=1 Tax=Halorussus ruber TaxID=1126238 RepID=UPI001092CA59|nr:S8/S53 family peptidase [Halorussus ruber]
MEVERSRNDGNFVRVGIADSIYQLPTESDVDSQYKINRRENYVASEKPDTTGHGTAVFDYATATSPKAVYNFYRVIAEEPDTGHGKAKRSNVVRAIAAAVEHGVDVLNLSLGVCHHEEDGYDCGGHCRIGDEARWAVEEHDVTIVTAIGNEKTADAVTCPGLLDEVIGVGGLISLCTNDVSDSTEGSQYWIHGDELYGPFCGQRKCENGQDCEDNRKDVPWDGNAPFVNAEPDVLAPAIRASGDTQERDASFQSGTSFATPLVTSSLVSILSDLIIEEGKQPSPKELQQAVTEASKPIDRSDLQKYSESATFDALRSR